MNDPFKLQLVRKTRSRRRWDRLRHRYLGSALRITSTLLGMLLLVGALGGLHIVRKHAAGEFGMALKRKESAALAAEYVRTPDFETRFIRPLRESLGRGATVYAAASRATVNRIVPATAKAGTVHSVNLSRTLVRARENAVVEVLRNLREHLAWRGYEVRGLPAVQRFQSAIEHGFIGTKLAELEKRHPGICPRGMASAVPETRELIARAIARSLEIPLPELGELIYCSEKAVEQYRLSKNRSVSTAVAVGS